MRPTAGKHQGRFVRSPAGGSRASLPQAQHRLSRLPLSAGSLPLRFGQRQRWCDEPVGLAVRSGGSQPSALPGVPSACALCSHRQSDESTEHSQSGRQALAFTGRRSVVAVAVVRRGALFSSHHVSSAVLGGVGFTPAVQAVVAVVAVVRLALPPSHRLAVGVAPSPVARLIRTAGVNPSP